MTLSPLFRSKLAIRFLLEEKGYFEQLREGLEQQKKTEAYICKTLENLVPEDQLLTNQKDDLTFLQDNFFLILFNSSLKNWGISSEKIDFYSRLNYCLRSEVIAADNIGDGEDKQALPIKRFEGSAFNSLYQLINAVNISSILMQESPLVSNENQRKILKDLNRLYYAIGSLEGSEEGGISDILPPEEMIEKVHHFRGGQLFQLQFSAVRVLEQGYSDVFSKVETTEKGFHHLGTAFQIVDDITDFEFDLKRKSNNLVQSIIHHRGTKEEKKKLNEITVSNQIPADTFENYFQSSGQRALDYAIRYTQESFETLQSIGFWVDPADAPFFVAAIAGEIGEARLGILQG